jgi:hypothetical protein
MNATTRPLSTIAADINQAWAKPYFGAVPYLEAMASLSSIEDRFYSDSARDIVGYFLANASTFRGDVAKQLKAELKGLLGR